MKNIVITGSTRGIGFAMGKEFLKAGCRVTFSGRGDSLPDIAAKELDKYEGQYVYVSCNVQDRRAVENLWLLSAAKWGGIDIWINNAGQNAPHAYLYETDGRYVDGVIDTNLKGLIYGSQVAAAGMLKQKHGAIYSMEGLGSNNMIQPRTVLYGTTKHALTYFMKGLARELAGTGVIAGRLSPGMMLTDFLRKTPDGEKAALETDPKFKKIFNILGDKPETVAAYFIPRILGNSKNGAQIQWLSNIKASVRFMTSPFRKRNLV